MVGVDITGVGSAGRPVPGAVDSLLVARYGRRRATELLGRPPTRAAGPAAAAGLSADRRRSTSPGARRIGPVIGIILGLAVVLGWVTWASTGANPGSVSSQLIAMDTPGADSVSAQFSMSAPTGIAVACVVDATDRNGTVLGRVVVRLPPSTATARRVHVRVATVARAVDVTVDGCQSAGQTGLH